MQPRTIPVACVQTRAHDRVNFDTHWPHVLTLVAAAGARGAKLVVLPEGTAPAYVLGLEPVEPVQLARAAGSLGEVAQQYGMTVVYGAAKVVRDHTFNAAIAIGPDGREIGYAAKQFLWHFDRRWFAAGTTLEPLDTPLGRLGLFICADGRIPTIAATLVERGAELLVMPTAWVTSGRDPASLENIQADLMANVRARENGVPLVVCNKVGVEADSVAYCGKSAIIAADGSFVARGSERDEAIVFGEVVLRPAERAVTSVNHSEPAAASTPLAARARIAFTLARDSDELRRFAEVALLADADLLLAGGAPSAPLALPVIGSDRSQSTPSYATAGGIRVAFVDSAHVRAPRGLVAARLAGSDLFLWEADGDVAWIAAFARTRAAELRAYVVVFDRPRERAFVVDPDGTTLAGTFGDYRLAAFVYDRARAAATVVAPATDVAVGLRTAERIRSEAFAQRLASGGLRPAIAD